MSSLRLIAFSLLFVSIGLAQSSSAPAAASQLPATSPTTAQKGTPATRPAAAAIPPDAPVIVIKGGCADAPPKAGSAKCTKQVTRTEFEKLINALNPDMAPNLRQSFAQNYGKLLVISNEARKRGLATDPNIQVMLEFAKLQILVQELGKRLQKQSNIVPQATVEAYYREHLKDFESADLQRIIIPRPTASKEKPVDDDAEKTFAKSIRDRWVAGEEPAKLQAETYERSGNKVQPPPVDLGSRRHGAVQAELPVFDLKAGDISEPINNQSAYFIYKVLKKDTTSLEKAQDEIKKTLGGQRLQAEMDKITKSGEAQLNDTYFGSAPPAAKPPATTGAKPNSSPTPAGVQPKTAK